MKLVQRIGGFFREMTKSCYDMEYYRGVRSAPLGKSFGYAVALHILMALLMAAFTYVGLFQTKDWLLSKIRSEVPAGAELTVSKGQVSTTLPQPFQINQDGFSFIIDTSYVGKEYPEHLKKTSGIMIGRDTIFMVDTDATDPQRNSRFSDLPDAHLTKDEVLSWGEKWGSLAVVLFGLAMMLLYWTALMAWSFVTIALYSLFALGIGAIAKVKLSYAQWYAIGLHAITLPIVGTAVLIALRLHVPFAYLILYFLIIAAVITDERNNPLNGKPVVMAAPDAPTQPPTIPPTTE